MNREEGPLIEHAQKVATWPCTLDLWRSVPSYVAKEKQTCWLLLLKHEKQRERIGEEKRIGGPGIGMTDARCDFAVLVRRF